MVLTNRDRWWTWAHLLEGSHQMARRKITIGDWLKGTGQSIRSGSGMSPLRTQAFINAAHDERVAAAQRGKDRQFGRGEQFGNRLWTPPVHGTTQAGRPVTISFGKGSRAGQTLVCDGHVSRKVFYAKRSTGLGHDHYLVDGTIAGKDTKRFNP